MLQLKNIATTTFVLLLTLFAQDTFAQRGQRGDIVERLKKHIELTPEQETELNAISEKYQSRIDALRNSTDNPGDNRDKIKELHQVQRAEVNKVLTADQEKILREKRMAHRGKRKNKLNDTDKKALRTELKQYHSENIKPVLTAQRLELENKISTADRATLAQLREVLVQEKTERQKGQRPTKEERTAEREAYRAKYAKELATLDALTQKYSSDLAAIRTAIQPQVEQWRKDAQAIKQKYATNDNGHHGKKKHERIGESLKGKRSQGRFLLMNPTS